MVGVDPREPCKRRALHGRSEFRYSRHRGDCVRGFGGTVPRIVRIAKFAVPSIFSGAANLAAGALFGTSQWLWGSLCVLVWALAFLFDQALRDLKPWVRGDISSMLAGFHAAQGWDENTRLTVYRRTLFKKDWVKQICPYAPNGKFGFGRRGFPDAKGIVGYCFRTGNRCIEHFNSADEYEHEMCENWGFDKSELGRISRDVRSYSCTPIIQGGVVTAVIYADSKRLFHFAPDDDQSTASGSLTDGSQAPAASSPLNRGYAEQLEQDFLKLAEAVSRIL